MRGHGGEEDRKHKTMKKRGKKHKRRRQHMTEGITTDGLMTLTTMTRKTI